MQIIMTKYAGLSGTLRLLKENRQRLAGRFNRMFMEETERLSGLLSTQAEERLVRESGDCAVYAVGDGGIYPVLWELWTESGFGFEVDLRRIPFKQHTVEICDYLDVNPFVIDGGGALVIVTDRTLALLEKLREGKIPARVIGRIAENKDKKLFRGETVGYLNRPETYESTI